MKSLARSCSCMHADYDHRSVASLWDRCNFKVTGSLDLYGMNERVHGLELLARLSYLVSCWCLLPIILRIPDRTFNMHRTLHSGHQLCTLFLLRARLKHFSSLLMMWYICSGIFIYIIEFDFENLTEGEITLLLVDVSICSQLYVHACQAKFCFLSIAGVIFPEHCLQNQQ